MKNTCSTCTHYSNKFGYAPDYACTCPKMEYGYGVGEPDTDKLKVENDESWGMVPGPDFGCIHHESRTPPTPLDLQVQEIVEMVERIAEAKRRCDNGEIELLGEDKDPVPVLVIKASQDFGRLISNFHRDCRGIPRLRSDGHYPIFIACDDKDIIIWDEDITKG